MLSAGWLPLFYDNRLWSSSLLTSTFFLRHGCSSPDHYISSQSYLIYFQGHLLCFNRSFPIQCSPDMITHLSPKKQHWSLKFLLAGTWVGGCPLLGFYFPFLLGCSLRKHPGLVPAPNHLYVLLINVCKKASWSGPLTPWVMWGVTMLSSWCTKEHPP